MNSQYMDKSSRSSNHQPKPIPNSLSNKNPKSSFIVVKQGVPSNTTTVTVKSIIEKDKTYYQIAILESHGDSKSFSDSHLINSRYDTKSDFKIVKRYSELLEFYEILKKRYKTMLIPHFPGKHAGRNSVNLVEYRRKKIQRFFNNLFNLKLSNFSKKKIMDIIGTIGVVSFKKSLKGNLKGLGSFFNKQVKNYIYDQIDRKEIMQVYYGLRRLDQNERLLTSVSVFIENEAKLFLKMDEKYFRFLTILNHYFSNKSIKEKNNLLESLNTFQEVEYLRKKQIQNVKVERLDKSVFQVKSNGLGPLKSSMDLMMSDGQSKVKNEDENFEEVTQADSNPTRTLDKITNNFPHFSTLYSNSNMKTLDKRKQREQYIKELGEGQAMNVFQYTMGKINHFFEILFELKCEIDEIGRVKDTIFHFFRNAIQGEELKKLLKLAINEQLDLTDVFSQK